MVEGAQVPPVGGVNEHLHSRRLRYGVQNVAKRIRMIALDVLYTIDKKT